MLPITILDIVLLAVMSDFGLLAMVRGFMREILSIASWAAAAIATTLRLPEATADREAVLHQRHRRDRRGRSAALPRHADRCLDPHHQDRRYDPRQPRGRARPHAGLPVRRSAAGFIIASSRSCSSPGWCLTAASPTGSRRRKSLEVLQGTGRWLMSLLPDDPEGLYQRVSRSDATISRTQETPPGERSDSGSPTIKRRPFRAAAGIGG